MFHADFLFRFQCVAKRSVIALQFTHSLCPRQKRQFVADDIKQVTHQSELLRGFVVRQLEGNCCSCGNQTFSVTIIHQMFTLIQDMTILAGW